MQIINPATEELITDLKEDNAAGLTAALSRLQQGQKKWYAVPLNERVAILQKFSELLKDNIED